MVELRLRKPLLAKKFDVFLCLFVTLLER